MSEFVKALLGDQKVSKIPEEYMTRLEVRKQDGMIVCTRLDDERQKWIFGEVTDDTFHWKNVTVLEDGGLRINCEVLAVRRKKGRRDG